MKLPATVEGRERVRVFVGLPVPRTEAEELARWARELPVGEGARRVRADDLHLTLAFLGLVATADLERVAAAVDGLAGLAAPRFEPDRYRETRSVGMLVLRDDGGRGAALAEQVQSRLEDEGLYRREARPWLPHVTVLRFGRSPRLRPELPNMRSIAPSDAAAYLSVLHPSGATYHIVHSTHLAPGGRRASLER